MNMRQTFYPTAPLSTSAPKDPRPLKERSFQAKLGQELLDYLTTNGFQMDTDHPLTQKSMTSPTQKDFNLVFQWLYKRIDPGYRFQKAIDAEVPPILKLLRYPFQASITKSQIAAVGGQNWSTFLGLLHWMMQLGITMDRYASGEFDALCLESGQDVTGELIVFDFLSASYGNWMTLDPEDEDPDRHLKPHIEAMAAAFDAANGKLAEELKIMEGENAALQAQLEELEAAVPDLAKLDEINRLLHEDAAMFEDYILSHGARAEKYEHRLRDLEERLAARDADLAAAEAERQALQAAVDEQGISIQDIDRMNAERERLLKGAEATAQRLEESQARLAEREADAHARLENLERALETYAGLGYTVGIIPAGAPNAQGQDLSLDLAGPDPKAVADLDPAASVAVNAFSASTARLDASDARLLQQPLNGAHTPSSILTRAPRTSIRPALTALQHTLSTRRQTASEAMLRDLDLLETLKETVEEKRAEVEAVEHRVRAAEEEFEKTKQVESCAGMSSRAEMERMEKELGRMRVGVGEGWRVMEQREAVVNVE